MARVILDISGLHFKYGSMEVLKDISLRIYEGEFTCLIGPNGSGKTTLLKCLCNLLKPYGSIYIDGYSISKFNPKLLAKLLSYVSSEIQTYYLDLSVFDFVSLGRTPHMKSIWWESKEDEEIILESMKLLKVHRLANRKFSELSSGERQRVKIARAVAQKPKILLIDEPTVHLDLKHKLEIMNLLKSLVQDGMTVIAAIHDLNLAVMYCDKVIVLNNGRVIAYGKPRDVLTECLIEDVYGAKVKIMWDEHLGHAIIVPRLT